MAFHLVGQDIVKTSPPNIEDYKVKLSSPCRIEGGLRFRGKFHRKAEAGQPLISIVTIVCNGEKYLEQTIQSVLNQTYDNIEYIIIDGGSTDGTLDIIKSYDNKIAYWISEPDEGISDAFNKGITASTGNIIGIINADDWYCTNTVEIIINEYLKGEEYIFHAKVQYWNSDLRPYYVFSGNDKKILYRPTINHPTVFVPKKIYDKIGLFSLDFKNATDYEWLRRAKSQGVRFCYIDQITANMRLDGKSDRQWFNNYLEIVMARSIHGMNPARNYFLFVKMVGLTLTRKVLEYIGLHSLVRIYRKYFSVTRKETYL